MCLWVSHKKKKYEKIIYFCILIITEENNRIWSWIRSRIRIHLSEVRIQIRTKMPRVPNTYS
jgi:hypothetical protein